MGNNKYILLTFIIFAVAFSRLIPHPLNYSPLGALALFAGAKFANKFWGISVVILATFISDVVLNNFFYKTMFPTFTLFYNGWYIVYLSYGLIALLGYALLKKVTIVRVLGGAVMASIIFFIVSNFSYWTSYNLYSKDLQGLIMGYTAAIPFFKGTLIGTITWSMVLFGVYQLFTVANYKPFQSIRNHFETPQKIQ